MDSPDNSAGRAAGRAARAVAPALAVALALGTFFAPALRAGTTFLHRDNGQLHIPMKRWMAEEFARGRLPEWNPYAGLGSPIVPNAAESPFHPLNLLLAALPAPAAVKVWTILAIGLAAAGAFLWARSLGRTSTASAIAAIAFALSGPMVSSTDNLTYVTTYAALPWLFAAAHRHVMRGGAGGLALAGVASLACIAGGDPQGWAIAVVLLPPYAAAVAERGQRRLAVVRGLAASAAAVLFAAPFLFPMAVWLPFSQRLSGMAGFLGSYNVHPRRLPELLLPHLFAYSPGEKAPLVYGAYAGDGMPIPWFLSIYLGASVLVLAAIGAARGRRERIFAAVAVAFLWASLGNHGGFGQLARHVPLLGGLRYWEKVTVWSALFGALAAAGGVDAILSGFAVRALSRAAAVAAALTLGVAAVAAAAPGFVAAAAGGPTGAGFALAANVARGALHAGIALGAIAALAALLERGKLSAPRAAGLLVCAVAADLGIANSAAYVLGPAERETQPPLAAALDSVQDRVVVPESLYIPTDAFPELGSVAGDHEWRRRTLVDAWNVPLHIGNSQDYVPLREGRWDLLKHTVAARRQYAALGLLGFGHLVVDKFFAAAIDAGIPPPVLVRAVDAELPAYLVEFPHRPRAYLADVVMKVNESAAFDFAARGGLPGVSVVEGGVRAAQGPRGGEARIVRDLPGDTEVETRADGPALLVLNDLHAPGWSASVDGAPASIVRANYVARGIWLEAGAHRVRFRYRTPGLAAGTAVAALGAAALAAWAVVRAWRRRRLSSVADEAPDGVAAS